MNNFVLFRFASFTQTKKKIAALRIACEKNHKFTCLAFAG